VLAGSPQLLMATAGPVLAAPETGTTTQPPLPASAPAALSGSGTASGAPAAKPAAPAAPAAKPAAPASRPAAKPASISGLDMGLAFAAMVLGIAAVAAQFFVAN